jgi:uncharacterized protein
MSLSMYQASVPVVIHALSNLKGVLEKAKAHAAAKAINEANFLTMRVIPDMLPFASQIRIACDVGKRGIARLADAEPPVHSDDEADFDALIARCQSVIDYLKTFKPEQIDGTEHKDIVMKTPFGDKQFKGKVYLFSFIIANVHFHSTMAYAMLRGAGVELGKLDYLGG